MPIVMGPLLAIHVISLVVIFLEILQLCLKELMGAVLTICRVQTSLYAKLMGAVLTIEIAVKKGSKHLWL
jgi:hypothetical protein